MTLEAWKKAVVHLECATDSEYFYDRINKINELRKQLDRGEITQEDFGNKLLVGTRDLRYHGTALFIVHEDRKYLLTARHVVFDEVSAEREFQEEVKRISPRSDNTPTFFVQLAKEHAQNRIFSIIFRVPSLDEMMKHGPETHCEFLMNLGAGTFFTVPYTFSSPELDLALISLDQRDSRFANQLLRLGYEPISSDVIRDEPSCEGCEVFTVGYPSSTALIGQISRHSASAHWSSSYFSLPAFSFGRVSMMHDQLPFYWTDMSIYPGNSGGPIIENDKLVGIVSRQAIIPIDSSPDVRIRIPFGKVIKTKYVRNLLQIQKQKDDNVK